MIQKIVQAFIDWAAAQKSEADIEEVRKAIADYRNARTREEKVLANQRLTESFKSK